MVALRSQGEPKAVDQVNCYESSVSLRPALWKDRILLKKPFEMLEIRRQTYSGGMTC